MRADSQRVRMPTAASASAMAAMRVASRTTRPVPSRRSMAFMTRPASSGVATVRPASTLLSSRNATSARWCRWAKRRMRRTVAAEKGCWSWWAWREV